MNETEIKILEIDRKTVEEKLISLGAHQVFDGDIHALYYDLPGDVLRRSGLTLRLRQEAARSVLTLKQHRENTVAKEREEIEVEVSDFDAMQSVLGALGFLIWLEMRKHRTSYTLNEAQFEFDRYLDRYGYIPEFLEIESRDTESLFRYAALLGFSRQECKPWDAVDLALHYAP